MNLETISTVFNSWNSDFSDDVIKARKAKGLAKWSRLQHMAEKLKGKKHSDISFTTAYPGKEGQTKILGSVEGNLHFLLGYANPGFHMASYHWQIIDPQVSDEEAEELYRVKGHPSRPELWERAGLEDKPEGDLELGMPHPSAVAAQEQAKREKEGIRVAVGVGTYLAVPSEGLVYGEHNNHVYTWDVVRDSFMAAMNPTLVEAMDAAQEEDVQKSVTIYSSCVPELVVHKAFKLSAFDSLVYPLVKSLFPIPGSIIPIETDTKDTVYGLVTDSKIKFVDKSGSSIGVKIYDRVYKSLDLSRNGDVHTSVLFNFGVKYLGLKKEDLEDYAISHNEIRTTSNIVKGLPTPGYENIPSTLEELESFDRAVMLVGNTYRLVLRASE